MTDTLADGRRLILASTSPFRRELLGRLGLPFEAHAPRVDETPDQDEQATDLVARLAEAKARSLASPGCLIIGSDQVATLDGEILGKPGDHSRAVAQLRRLRGRRVEFLTGLCLLNGDNGAAQVLVDPFPVAFRDLTDGQIEHYLQREQPYNCAGSFKSEGLGIALFHRLLGDDPNSLVGLPLIRLVDMLAAEGVSVL